MERGNGNRVKKAYGRRSPLKLPILPLIIQGVSMIASSVNKSNKKSKEQGKAIGTGKSDFSKKHAMGSGGGDKVAAAKPGAMSGGLKASGGAEKVKPMKAGLK